MPTEGYERLPKKVVEKLMDLGWREYLLHDSDCVDGMALTAVRRSILYWGSLAEKDEAKRIRICRACGRDYEKSKAELLALGYSVVEDRAEQEEILKERRAERKA